MDFFGSECAKEREGKCLNWLPLFSIFFTDRTFSSSFLRLNLAVFPEDRWKKTQYRIVLEYGRRVGASSFIFWFWCKEGEFSLQRL